VIEKIETEIPVDSRPQIEVLIIMALIILGTIVFILWTTIA
jgi:hypothetical protein